MTSMRRAAALLALLLALTPSLAHAVLPDEMLSDPKLEARARVISSELRCLVCQNESIDDSGAQLARDIRLLVRERLKDGDSNAQVRDYLVSRYGDFILLKPPFDAETALLWAMPALVLGGGALGLYLTRRRVAMPAEAPPLSTGEEARLHTLLNSDDL